MACTFTEEHNETLSATALAQDQETPGEPDSDKVYLGAVKSYNDRRGFGFIACAETSAEFGRDVYMSKLEAQLAAAGITRQPHEDPAESMELLNQRLRSLSKSALDKNGNSLRLPEEDLVVFMVKLSVEGYPKAVHVRRVQKHEGSVVRAPEWDSVQCKPGLISCQEIAKQMGSNGEVLVHQEACGQVRLVPGDIVTFCIPDSEDPPDSKLVMLASTARPSGSVLGCCLLELPRPALHSKSSLPPLRLDCHALGNKLVLSGLPKGVEEHELMRFFAKQGASKTIVAHAAGGSFASVTFPTNIDVCHFLGRSDHAVADEKQTRTATIHGTQSSRSRPGRGRLPALPAPELTPGDEPSSMFITWAPLQLAVAYVVEMRPAGTKEVWAAVDTGARENEQGHFRLNCSSCKVLGLRPGFAYEARVSYVSSCGCRSEPSDASQANVPGSMPQSAVGGMPSMPQATGAGYGQHGPAMRPGHAVAGHSQQVPGAGWRCAHGTVIPPPPPPEVFAADEAGFSIALRWPSVAHASAYVVELRETGSLSVERFMRSAESAGPGTLIDLRVGGLRSIPGRTYTAQVRCVSHCGCESAPSSEGYSPPMGCHMMPEAAMAATGPGLMSQNLQLPVPSMYHAPPPPPPPPQWMPGPGMSRPDAHLPPLPRHGEAVQIPQNSPWHVPAGFAYGPYTGPLPDASPISVHFAPSPTADAAEQQTAAEARLAAAAPTKGSLMGTSANWIAGAPQKHDFGLGKLHVGLHKLEPDGGEVAQKEPPPEVTGQEDCLILD
eukprot:TRINITY_DN10812_c0_g2_i1.p1 TRINITY_DN10812_c0_g2~~TRINITY_DN10812_c0_g2_i1.p1  ORF type:complete len:778 (+),score=121.10 TRINITY_DN10812_c0_g2_i1:84-2417(+)